MVLSFLCGNDWVLSKNGRCTGGDMTKLRSCVGLGAALITLLLSGCAVGNVYDFRYVPPDGPTPELPPKVVVFFEVEDLRKDILEGDEPKSWVGEQRGGYGNPFTVKTSDGSAFADVVQTAIRRDLEALGLKVEEVDSKALATAGAVAEKIRGREGDLGLQVKMLVYNSNTYVNIDMEWDFQLVVFDSAGKILYDEHIAGRKTLDGSYWNSPKAAKAKVPPAFYRVLHDMIVGNRELLEALGSDGGEAAGTKKCTVDQILTMKESGLNEDQIRAACGESG